MSNSNQPANKMKIEKFIVESANTILGDKTQYIKVNKNTNLSLLDSIEIIKLISLIEEHTHLSIEQETLYQIKTIDDLTNFITKKLQLKKPSQQSATAKNISDTTPQPQNVDLETILIHVKNMRLKDKAKYFSDFLKNEIETKKFLSMRKVLSVQDRTITILDPITQQPKELLMFGSNNYLGLANHPYIKQKEQETINKYGTSMTGSPLLNGYSNLTAALEEKLAALKHTEAAMIFTSGYGANVGVINAILQGDGLPITDELIHASIIDGIKLAHKPIIKFAHNDMSQLQTLLQEYKDKELFTIVEGVYSMDGDACPLDQVVAICEKNKNIILLDDAHGFGVLGPHGLGTAELYDVEAKMDIVTGTFSKTLAHIGGYACADRAIIDYLRFYSRSYMFSCAPTPALVAGIDAAIDIMQKENWRVTNLQNNIRYLKKQLEALNITTINDNSAIFAILVPTHVNVRSSLIKFNELGIFLNSVEYPAVQHGKERFRISLTANHTFADIDHLIEALATVLFSH